MNEITNKHLFLTMIIIGVITIGLLLSQYRAIPYGTISSYSNSSIIRDSLGASAYRVYDDAGNHEWYPNDTTSISVTPITQTMPYRYETYYYETPSSYEYTTTYTDYSYINSFMPIECQAGASYSIITGQPCW